MTEEEGSSDADEGEEEEGEVRGMGGRRGRARGRPVQGGRGVRPVSVRGRGGRGRSQEIPRGRPRGRGRGQARVEGGQQGRVEGGQQGRVEGGLELHTQGIEDGRGEVGLQLPAHRMDDGNRRVELGLQLPAHRMADGNMRVEVGLQLPAHEMEDNNRKVEGRQPLPAQGMEGLEDGQLHQEGQQERVEEEEVNGFLRDMANLLDQQGLQGPAVAVAPVQQGGQGDQPDAREDQHGDMYVVAGRERPVLPPPLPGPVAAGDGWEAIDRIGAEAAFRVCFPMLQQVDTQHSSAWARVKPG